MTTPRTAGDTETGPETAEDYNYAAFSFALKPAGLRRWLEEGPQPGGTAPGFRLETLHGATISLNELRGRPVVLEFGSYTCPVFCAHIEPMESIARRHPEAVFLVIYTREAHPGEAMPAHRTIGQKRRAALRLLGDEPLRRAVLLDDLAGTVHRAYGQAWDSTYVIDGAGTVVLRQAWTSPEEVDAVLADLAAGTSVAPRQATEMAPLTGRPLGDSLLRGGTQALLDFYTSAPSPLQQHIRESGSEAVQSVLRELTSPAHAADPAAGRAAGRPDQAPPGPRIAVPRRAPADDPTAETGAPMAGSAAPDLQAAIQAWDQAAWNLAALALAARDDSPPELAAAARQVLAAAGLAAADRQPLTGGSTSTPGQIADQAAAALLQAAALASGRSRSWGSHSDAALLAQGNASAQLARPFAQFMLPAMGDLPGRLAAPGARMLDIGTGVAALAVGFAREFPQLHVLGIDILDRALGLAHQTIAASDVADRVTVRKQDVASFTDDTGFDLAFLPAPFISQPALHAALPHVAAALHPGGWLIVGHGKFGGTPAEDALTRLKTIAYGGTPLDQQAACQLLRQAGLTSARTIPTPAGAPAFTIGQKPA